MTMPVMDSFPGVALITAGGLAITVATKLLVSLALLLYPKIYMFMAVITNLIGTSMLSVYSSLPVTVIVNMIMTIYSWMTTALILQLTSISMDLSMVYAILSVTAYMIAITANVIMAIIWTVYSWAALATNCQLTAVKIDLLMIYAILSMIAYVIMTVLSVPYSILAVIVSVIINVIVKVSMILLVVLKAVSAVAIVIIVAGGLILVVLVLHAWSDKLHSNNDKYDSNVDDRNVCEDDDSKRKHQGPNMAKVKMPTGRRVSVASPAKKCSCKTFRATHLELLTPGRSPEYRIVSEEVNDTIRQHYSGSYKRCLIVSIHKIENCCLWTSFRNRQADIAREECCMNQRMLFHGSPKADDITRRGFDERHSSPSGMFGAGIYFAEHSSKSNQYVFGYMGGNGCPTHRDVNCTTCVRKLLLCRVALGNMHSLTAGQQMAHPPPGFHSVAGVPTTSGLLYPEYIVYRGEQAYPEYLIAYQIVI